MNVWIFYCPKIMCLKEPMTEQQYRADLLYFFFVRQVVRCEWKSFHEPVGDKTII